MEKKQTLSACLIVKNEEKLLGGCLESIRDIADEIIVVDTGSDDRTVDIAKEYGAKVFEYPWDGSFANARNFSIRQAACDWILLPDADERFFAGDEDHLFEFMNTTDYDGAFFTIYNYVGVGSGTNYVLHNAFRLLRNNGLYMFRGDIHEQIDRIEGKIQRERFTIIDARLKHLGYLDWVIAEKDKRKRNIPMLEKQLGEDPANPFTLFNLGNEYMALRDFDRAYGYFSEAMENYKKNEAYSPNLMFQMAMCLYFRKQFSEAVEMAGRALKIYPRATDFEYFKGLVYWDWKRYTMAIDSFNRAMEMGEPPREIRFSDDCGTIKPLYALGKLYMYLHDYQKALDTYIEMLRQNSSLYYIMYDIGDVLDRALADKNEVQEKLAECFGSLSHLPNLLILTDVLLKIGLYGWAEKHLETMRKMEGYPKEKIFLEGKLLFFKGDFDRAEALLKEVVQEQSTDPAIFPHMQSQGLRYIFAAALMRGKAREGLSFVCPLCDRTMAAVYTQAAAVCAGTEENALADIEDITRAARVFEELLTIILKTKNYELFEKMLYTYNYFESDKVLLLLANVYLANGFNQMAVDTVMRSIRELNVFDSEGAEIMHRAYYN